MKTQMISSSEDENISSDDIKSDKETTIFSKEKICELKNSGYMKKKIISAIRKSLKTNNSRIHHTFTLNDVSVSEEKEIGNGCRQSLNIRIDLNDKVFYSSQDSGAMSIETFKLNDSTPVSKCSHCSEKENKEENIFRSYFVCVKCGKKEPRRWFHDNCKEKCCRSTSIFCDNCLKYKLTSIDHNFDVLQNAKFSKYMYVVTCPNGGGLSLHMNYEKIMNLTEDEQRYVAKEFLKEAFKEDKRGFAQFTIAIVHNGSSYMPDLLKLLAELHPTLPVKTTKLKCNIETENMDLGTYYTKVKETYGNGTFAFGPLNETQAASVKNDECGAYLPELLSLLEKSPFLSQVLPWSLEMTTKRFKTPHESDDGPIFWCRPGEQIVSLDKNSKRNRWNADEIETFLKERQQNLKFFCEKRYIVEELKKYRRSYSSREFLFEDRTKPHADQVWGNHFEPTAAVGVIQAIHPDEIPEQNRACKEIVMFHAKHFEMLEALLHIDVTAAPKQQCAEWLDDAKLNMIRQMNIRFSKLHLYDNDIYFIPRKIVHQFKTISATLSVAWHTRLVEYYMDEEPSVEDEAQVKDELLKQSEDDSSRSTSPVEKKPVKRKRKISYSTDNEGTPKKKKPQSRSPTPQNRVTPAKKKIKPRSRSGTPQKREKPVSKKAKASKTTKKNLNTVVETDESKERSPVAAASQDRSRSTSPVKKAKKKKRSRSKSKSERDCDGAANVQNDEPESRTKERSPSPSSAPVVTQDRSTSASPVKKVKKKKRSSSTSKSPKKRESTDSTEKKKNRSRSGSRKDEDKTHVQKIRSDSPVIAESSTKKHSDKSAKKKKKDRSRSKSPKKHDKRKDSNETRKSESSKGDEKRSHSDKTKHNGSHSSSEKQSSSPKKHDKGKKSSHRSRSPKKRDKSSDKSKSRSSSQKGEEKTVKPNPLLSPPPSSNEISSIEKPESIHPPRSPSPSIENSNADKSQKSDSLRSPSPSIGSMSTEKPSSPEKNQNSEPLSEPFSPVESAISLLPPLLESLASNEQSIDDGIISINDSTLPPMSPERMENIDNEPSSPVNQVPANGTNDIPPEVPSASSSDVSKRSPTPQAPPPTLIKQEPRSSPVADNRQIDAVSVKCEPRSPSVSQPKSVPSSTVKEEPRSSPKTTKETEPVKRVESGEKVVKKPVVADNRSNNKDGLKDKLWNAPLFSFEDCDKFVLTTRSNSTKNGDKVVKQKTLNNSDKNLTRRSRSKSPPSKKEQKSEHIKNVEERKKSSSEKREKDKLHSHNSISSEKRDKEKKPSSEHRHKESHSSDKLKEKHSDKKKLHSSTKDKSSENRDKTKSNHEKTKSKEAEKRKRSKSPDHYKKKLKRDRSRSKNRDTDKPDQFTESVVQVEKSSNDGEKSTFGLVSQAAENYGSNFRLMFPRVEIVDIGASLKARADDSATKPTEDENSEPSDASRSEPQTLPDSKKENE